jgi:asparagine synthase (glutamine-hydrolysing)
MIRKLEQGEVVATRPFGGLCPYYYREPGTGRVIVGETAGEMIEAIPKERRQLDAAACLALFNFNYPLGDRTMIQGLHRMPWHATLDSGGAVDRRPPLPHGHRLAEPAEIADALTGCLEEEIAAYLVGHRRVWVLLSGGLDSRITAGIVKRLQGGSAPEVHAVTWGTSNSRDVAYASRIAGRYGWEWHHLPYGEATLWDNLEIAAQWGGAEVAAVHLHAEQGLKPLVGPEDLVLASSWGDSVGRAEFSGSHLLRLTIAPIVNKYRLIHPSLFPGCLRAAQADRETAWCAEADRSTHVVAELDSQENYMRRMIAHAMNFIATFCRLEQAFTAEKTVRTMWSFSPICRQTEVYFRLLEKLDPFLFDLPWARSGVAPSGKREHDPALTRTYHEWGRWLREGRRKDLKALVIDGGLAGLGVLDMSQVRRCFKHWCKEATDSIGLTETILQLAGIELLRRRFELVSPGDLTNVADRLVAGAYTLGATVYSRIPALK